MDVLPFFTSHFSIGKSILTLDKPEEIIDNKPISIFSILKKHEVKDLYLVENNFSGFIEAFKNSKDNDINLRFGLKLVVCSDLNVKDEPSFKTESKIIIWMKNSEGYKDLIRIYSKAATDGFYYIPRIDWDTLNKMLTKNLSLTIPFYSSFLHQNLLKGYSCVPEFGKIKPNIMISDCNLPFDGIIRDAHLSYAKNNDLDIISARPIYYYSKFQWDAYCTFRCINNRSSFNKPNLDNFASDGFSFLNK